MSVDYAGATVPADYVCRDCGATGCKLWRQYQTFVDHIRLLCLGCAERDQKRTLDISSKRDCVDQIGWLVPAVPTENGETYWGYTSVPTEGAEWWYRLPTGGSVRDLRARLERAEAVVVAARAHRDAMKALDAHSADPSRHPHAISYEIVRAHAECTAALDAALAHCDAGREGRDV